MSSPGAARSTSGDFEGELHVNVQRKTEKEPEHFDFRVKGPRSRFTFKEHIEPLPKLGTDAAKIMFDTVMKKTVVFIESEKAYVVFPTEQLAKQLASFDSGKSAKPAGATKPVSPKVTDLGKLDTVAGVRCEQWKVQLGPKEYTELCVASRAIPGLKIPAAALPAEFAYMDQFLDGQHLPLRAVHFDAKGVEDSRVEVERIDDRAIDTAEFVVPREYRRVDLTEHPGMLAAAAVADKTQGGPVTKLQ
jgi:hypothetical protein